jgi:hypothetical protein
VSAGTLDFLVNINQKLVGGDVAGKLGGLTTQLTAQSAALKDLEKQQGKSSAASKGDASVAQGAVSALKSKSAALGELKEKMTGALQAQEQGAGAVAGFKAALAAVPPVAKAVIAVILAVVAGTAVLVYALASFALASADAHRSFMLVLQGATGSAAGAREASAAIDAVRAKSSVATPELQKMAQTLALAKIKGALFQQTLQQMANVASIAGPQAAGKLEEILKKTTALGKFEIQGDALAGLGISMKDLAKEFGVSVAVLEGRMKAGKVSVEDGIDKMNKALNKRFGKVAEQQALSFGVQLMRLHENLAILFRDVNIEPFLLALKDVLSVFDTSTSTGKALKFVLTETFSGLFAILAKLGPFAKAFFQGMIIAALTLYIALKPVARAIAEAFGNKSSADNLALAVTAGQVAVYGLLVVVALLVAAWALLASPVLFVLGILGLLLSPIASIVSAMYELATSGNFAGSALVEGFVNGITGGIGAAIGAVTSLGSAAMGALKSVLKIASPSGVFAEYGSFTSEGFAEGVGEGAPKAKSAVAKMVDVPKGGAGSRGRGGGDGALVHVEGGLHFHGSDESMFDRFKDFLETLELSGPEPEGAT